MKRLLALAMVTLALVACEESIKNGIIPEEHRATAKQYQGSFSGQFAGQPMTLTFTVEDSGYAVLSVKDSSGRSELVDNCASQIGQLLAVDVRSSNKTLRSAKFAFNGRACGLVDNTLIVEVDSTNQLSLYVAESQRWEHGPQECHHVDPHTGPICQPGRPELVTDRWLTGTFVRN